MTTWQRRTRTLVGIVGLCLGAIVLLTLKDRSSIQEPDESFGLNPDLSFHSVDSVVTQVTGERRNLRVEAEQHFAYSDGSSRLDGVRVIVDDENGDQILITSREGQVGQSEHQIEMTGDVILEASDGFSVHTEQASYDHRVGSVSISGPLAFSRGQLAGSAVGALFDDQNDQLRLFSESQVTLGRLGFTSDVAVLADTSLSFSHDVLIEEGSWTTVTQAAYVQYDQAETHVELVRLREQARMDSLFATPGSVVMMQAREIDLGYDKESGLLNNVKLLGNSEIRLAGSTPTAGERIVADSIDVSLAADEGSVTFLEARESVEIDSTNGDSESLQQIRAGIMISDGDGTRGLTKMEFMEDVEFRSLDFDGTNQRELITEADRLEASLAGSLGEMESARFTGHVRFSHGDTNGVARLLFYDINAGLVRLRSYGGEGEVPHIMDPNVEIEAEEIDLALDGTSIRAQGDVRSVLSFSGIFSSSTPTYARAGQLTYDSKDRRTTYSGGSRLWQGNTAIQGEIIEIHQDSADVRASGDVRSTFTLEEVDDVTSEVRQVQTIGVANSMRYEGVARRATYTDEAHVNGPQGDLSGDEVELYFGRSHRELERVESRNRVKLLLTGVTATGLELTYFTTDGRYIMRGSPVQILEELPGECRETQGKLLTFFRSSETVSVDGNEEVRTITRTTSIESSEEVPAESSSNLANDGAELVATLSGNCPQPQFN